MPEEVAPTPTAAESNAGNDDPRDGASKGIVDRLDRLEKKFERERLAPLQQQIEAVKSKLEEQGLDLAIFGFDTSNKQEVKPAVQQEAPKTDNAEFLRLQAAYNAGLPQEVLPLITASTEEEIQKQVLAIKALNPRGRVIRQAPIAAAPDGSALPVYKASQMRDANFYEKNRKEIHQAIAEGRYDPDN